MHWWFRSPFCSVPIIDPFIFVCLEKRHIGHTALTALSVWTCSQRMFWLCSRAQSIVLYHDPIWSIAFLRSRNQMAQRCFKLLCVDQNWGKFLVASLFRFNLIVMLDAHRWNLKRKKKVAVCHCMSCFITNPVQLKSDKTIDVTDFRYFVHATTIRNFWRFF